ncbi:Na(+)/H(+) exchange regulatory cofactor NHE-RF1 [Trichomycterus rosablanca]|uniref:Na(+)/H(+) exchange regulatory cofactor NHE-RF1 n=1 Tax=Trichomycterus rosablanca TaxID=2290929 RepID=UPI002F35D18F
MPVHRENLRPRLCVLEKGDNGYGFHLHGEKGKTGQFIRLVEPDSPAEGSGLRAGDRLVFVNDDNVESESHQQVVSRIRATSGKLQMIVIDPETDQLLKKHHLKCLKEYVTDEIPVPECELENGQVEINGNGEEKSARNGEKNHSPVEKKISSDSSEKEFKNELRPRLCVIRKDSHGFGFNLHTTKSKPGQYIRAIDEDSPAERAGLQPKDRIIQVNGVPVEGMLHADVVATIKAGGDSAVLLVVDPDTDSFFERCKVAPAPQHMTGPLPEPDDNWEMEDKFNKKADKYDNHKASNMSVSPSPSNVSSNASLLALSTETLPTEAAEPSIMNAIPALNLSLQQVKEQAHQKRSNKRAPPMDWNKKYELFSNL